MADIVPELLEQLSSIILHDKQKIVMGVEKEVKSIINNFHTIKAELADAEKKQWMDDAVKDWLAEVKGISYDMDDALDEWRTAILKSLNKGDIYAPKPVSFSFCSSCFPCVNDDIIACKIKEINARLDDIVQKKDKLPFHFEKSIEPVNAAVINTVESREVEKDTITGMLLGESNSQASKPHVISIVGRGGIGKTTLAELVYKDGKVEGYFDKRIWVCVSNSFDEVEVVKVLKSLLGLQPSLLGLEPFPHLGYLLHCISKYIEKKRFLLVLDDVREEDFQKWKLLINSFDRGSLGSKILVTTRDDNIANVIGSTEIFQLGPLSMDESRLIFTRSAFSGRTKRECENLEQVGQDIIRKCKGFPLAVETLGNLLRFKKYKDEWWSLVDSKLWELEVNKGLFAPLLLSYHDMPCKIRQCLSFCAVFPRDHVLVKDELISLWMAQGYIRVCVKEIEMIGEEILENLAARSLFRNLTKDENDRIITCKMHDLVHDFIQNFKNNECVNMEVDGLQKVRMDSFCTETRHLMVNLNKEASFPASFCSLKRLRSLFVESKIIECDSPRLEAKLSNLFEELTSLRALKLSGFSMIEVPQNIGQLKLLRHLDLSVNDDLLVLPESVCGLYNLQTLNLTGCRNLGKLPRGIGRLRNLRYLRNYKTSKLIYIPKGIERLTSLRSIDEFFVSCGGPYSQPSTLGDLKNFNLLQKYLEIRGLGNVRDVGEAKRAQLNKKRHLTTLILSFDGEFTESKQDEAVIEAFEPPPNLECLKINHYKGFTLSPSWLVSLVKVKRICLRDCKCCDHMPPLGNLPSLEYLEIRGMQRVEKVGHEFLGIETDHGKARTNMREASSSSSPSSITAFPRLKELRFWDMPMWEEWDTGVDGRTQDAHGTLKITIMPSLLLLEIRNCLKLKTRPFELLQMSKWTTYDDVLMGWKETSQNGSKEKEGSLVRG